MKRMYILIKDTIPLGKAINSAAHAGLIGYLKFKDFPETEEWLHTSFRKVTCQVTEKEFEEAKKIKDHAVVTEATLDGMEVALVFKPAEKHPKSFKYYTLYGRNYEKESNSKSIN